MPEFKVCAARVAAATSRSRMSAKRRLVVVGNGMAGARLVEDVHRPRRTRRVRGHACSAASRTATTTASCSRACWPAATSPSDIFINPLPWYAQQGVDAACRRSRRGDRRAAEAGVAAGAGAKCEPHFLTFGAGLRTRRTVRHARHRHRQQRMVPPIDGLRTATVLKDGVFVFRTLDDCHAHSRRAPKRRDARSSSAAGCSASKPPGTAESRPRSPRPPPDGPRDGRAARCRRRRHPQTRARADGHARPSEEHAASDGTSSASTPRHRRRLPCGQRRRASRDVVDAISSSSPPASDRTSTSRSAPGCEVDRGIVVGDDLACRPTHGRLRGRRVRPASRTRLRPGRAGLGTGSACSPIG